MGPPLQVAPESRELRVAGRLKVTEVSRWLALPDADAAELARPNKFREKKKHRVFIV